MSNVPVIPRSPESDQEMTLAFIARYRKARGFPETDQLPANFREALGDTVKMYRYRAPGRQFAITSDPKVRDALLAAGAMQSTPFLMCQGGDTFWDINLPEFLWAYL